MGVVIGLLGLALLTVYMLLRPERFTAFLHARAQAAGLDLELAYPAIPTLFPHPAIKLQGLTLSAPGASQPILVADHGQVELPWIALFQRDAGIAWLQLEAPRVDIDALQDWIRNLPADTFAQAPSLPRIDAGISIFHGSLVGHRQQPWLDDLSINAGALYPGRLFHLELAGSLDGGRPFSLQLHTVPSADKHRIKLRDLQLQINYDRSVYTLLRGQLDWLGGQDLSIQLDGSVRRADQANATLQLQMNPAQVDQPLQLGVRYHGDDGQVDMLLPPRQFFPWWALLTTASDAPLLSLPQWRGHLRVEQLDIGAAHIEELQIDAAPGSSAAAPATAASAGSSP
ncbi:AsmA family protein [Frateuria aurantia]